jgi:DNA-binding transcriptional LysR family regulator
MSKYDEALKAINRLYSDLTVAPEATLELLRDLRCEIDDLIIVAGRTSRETIYYRKVGGRTKSISRLHIVLSPTHDYTDVNSWEAAKQLLAKRHKTDKVFESSDMFKVHP